MRKTLGIVAALWLAAGCGQGSGGAAAAVKEYADKLCACTTASCLEEVQKAYQERLAKLTAQDVRPENRAAAEATAKDMQRATDCFRKIAVEATTPH